MTGELLVVSTGKVLTRLASLIATTILDGPYFMMGGYDIMLPIHGVYFKV